MPDLKSDKNINDEKPVSIIILPASMGATE